MRAISEETANLLTHAAGLVLSIIGAWSLLLAVTRLHNDVWQIVGSSVYAATLVALYASSTLSHGFQNQRLRYFFRTSDQVCIFLLIAGTFTPIAMAYLLHGWWWLLIVAMWGIALVGSIFKIFFIYRNNVAVYAYVIMGWLPIIAVKPFLASMPTMGLVWCVAGGVLYTLGTLFLARDEKIPYFHAVWHLFVIAGSASHYFAVWIAVLG